MGGEKRVGSGNWNRGKFYLLGLNGPKAVVQRLCNHEFQPANHISLPWIDLDGSNCPKYRAEWGKLHESCCRKKC